MAEGGGFDLNELFAVDEFDVTDEFEELNVLDSKNDEDVLEVPDTSFKNVTKDKFVVVLTRISDRGCNILDEAIFAWKLLANIKEKEANILPFLKTIQTPFSSFNNVKMKAKEVHSIRREQNFLRELKSSKSGKSWLTLVEFTRTKIFRRLFWNMYFFIFGS